MDDDLPPLPQPRLGRYRHYKGGEYELVGVARHSETLEPLALYRPLNNQTGLWVRPYAMFFEDVKVDGRLQPRFAPQSEPLGRATLVCLATAVFVAAAALFWPLPASATPEARAQVWAAEVAFAKTMADRKLQAFGEFIADDAVFFSGTTALHGKAKVIEGWTAFFTPAEAPFAWEPDQVEVLASGSLALSTGPVRDPSGKVVARFNSIWRLEAPNVWRVVFDKGSPPSPGPK